MPPEDGTVELPNTSHRNSYRGAEPDDRPEFKEREVSLPTDLTALPVRLDAAIGELYGERYRGLVLYGSYARQEADEGSDVDLLLLLDGEVDPAAELRRVHPVKWPLTLEAGYTVAVVPVGVRAYEEPGEPFLRSARREGVAL